MVYISRLKVMLIGLALISIIFGASSVFAAASGPHILLRLDTGELINRRLEAVRDQIRKLLRDAEPRINYTGLVVASGGVAQLHINDPTQVEAAKVALKTVVDPVAGKEGPVQEIALDDSEPGLLKFAMTNLGVKYRTSAALAQSIEIVENRLRDLGVSDVVVQQQDDGILVQTPGFPDPQKLGRILAAPGRLSFRLVDVSASVNDAIIGRPPPGTAVVYTAADPQVPYLVEDRVLVSGDSVLDARAIRDGSTEQFVVAFRLDSKGTERFKWATTQNVGKLFAIILDDHVISAPVIREPIESGSGQISGNFTGADAQIIALLMRTGALPARLTIVEEAR